LRFEVERTWTYYERAVPLRSVLSEPGRRILDGFLQLYSGLLREIERADYDVFTRRVQLSRWKKTSVTLRCLLGWASSPLFPKSIFSGSQ
jgi:phytoene synthase